MVGNGGFNQEGGLGSMVDAMDARRAMQSGETYQDSARSQRYRAFRYEVQSEGLRAALKGLWKR
ncbi:MAG: hypothetical protein E7458_10065 [Ruminococcaceae bacterium]|nr:hypothetical protein [Oscillospiraceae bacterium]